MKTKLYVSEKLTPQRILLYNKKQNGTMIEGTQQSNLQYGGNIMAILEYNVDSFFNDIFNRFTKKISEFVYDDELLFSVEGVEGYVRATDDLVYRLKEAVAFATEKTHFEDLEPMDNINFYPVYNVVNNTVSLKATYWYIDNGSEKQNSIEIPLFAAEKMKLILTMEDYCNKLHGKTCRDCVNEGRREENLSQLASMKEYKPFSLEANNLEMIGYVGREKEIRIPRTFISLDGVGYEVREIGDHAFTDSALEKVVLPDTITKIGASAFSSCHNLTSIVFPQDIKEIGDHAFSGCWSLTGDMILPDELKIGEGVFNGCKTIEHVVLPADLEKIEAGMFNGCQRLQSVTLSENIKEIGAWAFFECDGLETVEYRGSEEQKKAIQIEVGNDPLENCLAKNSAVRTVAEFAEQHKQHSKDNMERE